MDALNGLEVQKDTRKNKSLLIGLHVRKSRCFAACREDFGITGGALLVIANKWPVFPC